MNRSKSLILTLTLWISLMMCPQVECGQDGTEETGVTIELTKLDVNDTTLELSYKIKNDTDHDVWICDSVSKQSNSEIYLAEDAQTLVIRKLLDISPEVEWGAIPIGRYVRLQPAQEYSESLSCALPVRPASVYIPERANAESAKRLVLEIGFYDQDLPGLIRSIIEVVERFSCANVELEDYESDIMRHYFKGLLIKGRFGGLEYFDEYHQNVSEQFITAYTDQLLGEQVLRIEVDGLYIPYKGYAPAAGEPANNEVEDTPITIALTKLDVNDTNLELSWKIKNNTDHDVWICDRLSPEYPSFYEYFLDKDGKTLVLRRRSDLPIRQELKMKYPPLRSRYVRLRSGQEKAESVSLAMPVRPYRISEGESGNAECAKRLVLEIGFYNEDLPGLILQIVELAEKLNCDLDVGVGEDEEISDRFFGGRNIAQAFKHLLGFSESVMSAFVNGEFTIHYLGPLLNGEQRLRITVDGVSIPYKSS